MLNQELKPIGVQVALDVPLRTLFDYRIPAALCALDIKPGIRVKVPFGRKTVIGVVVSLEHPHIDESKLKDVLALVDDEPLLDPETLKLLRFGADYYHHPIGEAVIAALPIQLRSERAIQPKVRRFRLGSAAWPSRLTKGQARIFERLSAQEWALESELKALGSTIKKLINDALDANQLIEEWVIPESTPPAAVDPVIAPALNDDQSACVSAVEQSLGQFEGFLLEGVTGSGKTEVYLKILDRVRAQNGQALVLVPEIGLTPQTQRRFEERFPNQLAILHSGLSDVERLKQWRAAFLGHASIVIGTRSAVFAPLKNLSAIIIDEEHDLSYKQQDGFRYSAKDLGLRRAQQLQIPILLGSATPSLESLKLAADGKLTHLKLFKRAHANARMPTMSVVDLRVHPQTGGLAPPTVAAIERHLNTDRQVLIYLNRRGFAPTLYCSQCAHSIQCEHCDARMTVHLKSHKLRCHHCNAERNIPFACPNCQAELHPIGTGTERLEDHCREWFPHHPIARLDRDVITHQSSLQETMERIRSNQARILVGTQMLTKGHDFPNVTLVVVVNADQGLFGTDFRSSERMAQTIIQVAGRAGRADHPGEVLVQTSCPDHPLIRSLLADGYSKFAEEALKERAAHHWPPYSRLALIRADGLNRSEVFEFLDYARTQLKPHVANHVKVLGPAPALLERRAERYRAQLMLESYDRQALHSALKAVLPSLHAWPRLRRIRFSLDIDPLDLS